MKKMRQTLALLLAGALTVGSFAGCGGSKAGGETAGTETAGTEAAGTAASGSDTPLVIANDGMSEKFSPFFAESVPDQNIVDVTQISLVYNDRSGEFIYNGIEGETTSYNGTDYTYYGPTDLTITENEDGTVYYDFKLRDDLTFSDGEPVTADDIIFSFYVFCDPTYDGGASVYSLPIEGMEEYRSGMSTLASLLAAAGEDNTEFTFWTEDQQNAFWDAVNDGGAAFAQEIVDYCVENGVSEEGDVAGAAAQWGFDGLAADATAKDFFMAIGDKYGWSFTAMEAESAGSALSDLIPADVYAYATEGVETGDAAANISGIQKLDDKTVRVVLTEVSAPALQTMDIQIAPLHYYGDESQYDYDNNQFGFTKGDLSAIREKTTAPLGAGPYAFKSYENKTVYLEANESYYKGAPATKELQFKETAEADKLPGVVQGTVDISDPSISKEVMAQICSENSNGEASGDVLTTALYDNNGYGYIGINSQNVKVGDDPSSEQSKDLRKAIATVISVYRDMVIDSYYGDAASVINYPISNTSWAAPQKSDADYEVAFSKDVDGNPIYTDGMSDDEKYAAALDAALGFFEAAGYTVTDGKLTAAPAGAKLSYEVMIGGSGKGDHPSFGILTAASEALKSIGFDLTINDLADGTIMWDALNSETAEMWCAAWQATLDPDMFQIYHSEGGSANYYAIYSDELDELVMEGRTNTDQAYRKAVYKEALDFIVDYAVEIPVYQRQNASVFSTQRVNVDSIPQDLTTFYSYLNEIEKIQMN
ncbi:MAG: ABC transporter substrate-binding protein [Roseburia hominis]